MSKIIYLPAELTARLGYFQQEGLNVQLLDVTTGVSAEDEWVSGQVDGVVGFYDHVIDLQAKGKNLVDVVQLNATPGERLMVVNSEKNNQDVSRPKREKEWSHRSRIVDKLPRERPCR